MWGQVLQFRTGLPSLDEWFAARDREWADRYGWRDRLIYSYAIVVIASMYLAGLFWYFIHPSHGLFNDDDGSYIYYYWTYNVLFWHRNILTPLIIFSMLQRLGKALPPATMATGTSMPLFIRASVLRLALVCAIPLMLCIIPLDMLRYAAQDAEYVSSSLLNGWIWQYITDGPLVSQIALGHSSMLGILLWAVMMSLIAAVVSILCRRLHLLLRFVVFVLALVPLAALVFLPPEIGSRLAIVLAVDGDYPVWFMIGADSFKYLLACIPPVVLAWQFPQWLYRSLPEQTP